MNVADASPPAQVLKLDRWAYRSRANTLEPSLALIADILAVSERNNRRDDISGSLVLDDGWFFQVMEGPAEALGRLMRRLELDSRHCDIEAVHQVQVTSRLFRDWSMSAPRLAPSYAPLMRQVVEASRTDPPAAIRLLHKLAIEDSVHPGAA
ncbi:Sensors of blue-light using FAD family [Brevundimonas sp. BAL3]|uniref:BLUF domain-containing protein n=1 Tax=Brevundimonas sp. BAL3 TaxID=391600 RepID=UPI00017ED519|nr:BLUF domain-containing protein [Brevundimonas sp. BAL3]EDX81999.1 Sensors of blue-light using FAD family [Brevundimonas sp. BAL3]